MYVFITSIMIQVHQSILNSKLTSAMLFLLVIMATVSTSMYLPSSKGNCFMENCKYQVCEKEFITFFNPEDCRSYYECALNCICKEKCTEGLIYDHAWGYCVLPENARSKATCKSDRPL
uniref:Chitin-binding type-2 domain-containing protein n=1 Tax=Lepeophtheirus salmonis TaxID=72036 RepID=A0A0K2T0P1_LEPSM